jgi:hypothetical protein
MTTTTAPVQAKQKQGMSKFRKIDLLFMNNGTPIIDAQNLDDLLDQSGLNWTVSKRSTLTTAEIPHMDDPVKDINPRILSTNGTPQIILFRQAIKSLVKDPNNSEHLEKVKQLLKETENQYIPIPHRYAIVRNDTNTTLAVVGKGYQRFDNRLCLSFFEAPMQSGQLEVTRAGYFDDGARIWVFGRLPKPVIIGNQKIWQFIRIGWSHDMTEKLTAQFHFFTEDGCNFSPSIPGFNNTISLKHTLNGPQRVLEACAVLEKQGIYAHEFKRIGVSMSNTECNHDNFLEYIKKMFPKFDEKKLTAGQKEVDTADRRIGQDLIAQYKELDGPFANTQWGAFGVFLDYADKKKLNRVHGKDNLSEEEVAAKGVECRWKGSLFGDANKFKTNAWNVINNVAGKKRSTT